MVIVHIKCNPHTGYAYLFVFCNQICPIQCICTMFANSLYCSRDLIQFSVTLIIALFGKLLPRKLKSRIQETNFCEILFNVFFNKYQVNTLISLVTVLMNIILLQVYFFLPIKLPLTLIHKSVLNALLSFLLFMSNFTRIFFFYFITVIDQVNYS